ncbi:MAG: 3'-5' exonuclease domain-containing protein 2 [Bacteroides sp.]|nr:3'-5' exonuclease domain-containing protein 2 [Bacteroides sp.]MCM1378659.1 3'-5' exonuclease domain-containing protein 2 [Bacteroides sp.]MCM1444932.1 3'-5' exonuclease domain-containing protein 2 [Prevotella sp.]
MELKTIDKETLSKLPAEVFSGRIELVQTPAAARKAIAFLMDQPVIGFDTETRPSFRKGDNHKVALMQLSTENICFLIRLNRLGIMPELKELLECENVLKIGLSTKDDFHVLNRIEPLSPKGFVELQSIVKEHGIGEASLTKIYALLFGKRISKAQRLTNWEATELTPAQQHYAALDAYACLRIFREIQK